MARRLVAWTIFFISGTAAQGTAMGAEGRAIARRPQISLAGAAEITHATVIREQGRVGVDVQVQSSVAGEAVLRIFATFLQPSRAAVTVFGEHVRIALLSHKTQRVFFKNAPGLELANVGVQLEDQKGRFLAKALNTGPF